MPTQLIYRYLGPSYALPCGVSSTGPVTISAGANDIQAIACLNFTNTAVAVAFQAVNNNNAPVGFQFPTQNNPSGVPCAILPPLMDFPMIVSVPRGGCTAFGVAQSTGTPVIQLSPVEVQS